MDMDTSIAGGNDLPEIDETSVIDDARTPKDRLLSLLDKVEAAVENMRKEALKMEEEKDALFTTLDTVRNSDVLGSLSDNDREDIQRYIDRVSSRCMTVEIHVRTNRDQIQEDALHQVNHLIDSLVINLKGDPSGTKVKCMSYMAACSSYPQGMSDKNFESAILGCTLDDQKRIRKRLQGLLEYINREPKITGIEDVMPLQSAVGYIIPMVRFFNIHHTFWWRYRLYSAGTEHKGTRRASSYVATANTPLCSDYFSPFHKQFI